MPEITDEQLTRVRHFLDLRDGVSCLKDIGDLRSLLAAYDAAAEEIVLLRNTIGDVMNGNIEVKYGWDEPNNRYAWWWFDGGSLENVGGPCDTSISAAIEAEKSRQSNA
jgi:hypothetical protein